VPLFERHRRGMRLTHAGEELLRRVSGLVRQLDQSYADVRSLTGPVSGHVAFGIVPTVSDLLAAKLVRRVAEVHPGISVRIVESYGGHLLEWLQKGEMDVAILYGPQSSLHLKASELLVEDMVAVAPPTSEASPGVPIAVTDFVRLPLVLPSRPHGLRMLLETAALRARAKLDVRYEVDSYRVLKELVEEGLGYTALPLSAISREVQQGRLRYAPLAQPRVARQLILATPEGVVSHGARAVIELARREVAALVQSGHWRARLQFAPDSPWR
jgi:LysR family transcriptional regulator, nitrogen assimilation regulatory protein